MDSEALVQQLGADPRVQFPSDAAPLESFNDLARATIELADAIATGDEQKLISLLTPAGQATLDQLTLTGEWFEATGGIEQVRVIFVSGTQPPPIASPGMSMSGIESAAADMMAQMPPGLMEAFGDMMLVMAEYGDTPERLEREFSEAITAVLSRDSQLSGDLAETFDLPRSASTEEILAAMEGTEEMMGDAMGPGGVDMDPEEIAVLTRLMDAVAESDEATDGVRQFARIGKSMMNAFASMSEDDMDQMTGAADDFGSTFSAVAGGAGGSVVLAIQEPGASYLLGWGAIEVGDGTWIFTGAPTTSETRARAAMWDGIDGGAFAIDMGGIGSFGDSMFDFGLPDFTMPGEEDEEDGPRIQRTPRGPVTIPGSG